MQRDNVIARLDDHSDPFDVLVIGGGATGFACAIDALSRGYTVALVERGDFGEGTSSRSTKLIHGGVRYLRQGNIKLVRESLRERDWFFRAAPHLVQPLEFIIPCRSPWERLFYRTGLEIYDWMAKSKSTEQARFVSKNDLLNRIPGCAGHRWIGGVRYFDGQFDDARMIITFLHHLAHHGGYALNYAAAVDLIREGGKVRGAIVEDRETGTHHPVHARVVINATGVFSDQLIKLDQPAAPDRITTSQGIHLVLDGSWLGGSSALMIPKTRDGRVLFAIPWHGCTLFGTTDTPRPAPEEDPVPLNEEVEYLLEHGRKIFLRPPRHSDIRGTFAGLRPLPRTEKTTATSAISRDFKVDVSPTGFVSVYGGKWTTCRAMGEAAVDQAARFAGFEMRPSRTRDIVFTANHEPVSHQRAPTADWVAHAVENEMARTLTDLLLRRTRLGLLDAAVARNAAPLCAQWMAGQLGHDKAWVKQQLTQFSKKAGLNSKYIGRPASDSTW